mgnify:CR=1 FL=1
MNELTTGYFDKSRNLAFNLRLAKGKTLDNILRK